MSKEKHSDKKQSKEVATEKAPEQKPVPEKPVPEKPVPEKPVSEKAAIEKPVTEKSDTKKPATKKKKSWLVISGLIFIVLILAASAAVAYYFWKEQQRHEQLVKLQQTAAIQQAKKLSTLSEELHQIKTGVAGNTTSSAGNTQQLQQLGGQLVELNEQIKLTEAISQQAIDIVNRTQRGWALAEIDYLLRMAHQRIAVARDIRGAIAALKGADARLVQLADLKLFGIRKQLAKDISHLNAIHQVDINGISLEIDQTILYLSELGFKTVKDKIKKSISDAQARENPVPEEEQTFVGSVWNTVKKLSDLEVHQTSIEAVGSAQQKTQIERLLRTYLLSARLAVLRFDQQQFIYEINQASEILNKEYNENDNRVSQLKKTLNGYRLLELNPNLPQLTKAWIMLQEKITAHGTEAQVTLQDSRPIKIQPIKEQPEKKQPEKKQPEKKQPERQESEQ
ncbi:hypothetical protein MNBD_GAMMA10-3039 [hydrothermal vent metagenome]|uniref:Uroporphyrinogen-III C-methyltransferase n=1 Tax=hydrothermal vent metagenome TaxID=652676 RepID=A0A3B0XUS3_9ZZZZ